MLIPFVVYIAGVFFLGFLSHRFLRGGSFVRDYFLGNRQLGAWVLAISFAATAISGGSFMGFPSLIYTYGWVMALWIAGYMVVPLVTMAVLGKRINQVSRLSGAVTIPDLLRDRYESPAIGLLASLVLIAFLGVNLVAQFKAGGLLVLEACREVFAGWGWASAGLAAGAGAPPPGGIEAGYVPGLALFVAMVVAYTTYGGFWGVTLTDVLEGLVMLAGAVTLAVLAVVKVGGLDAAGAALLRQSPDLVYAPGPAAAPDGLGYLPLGAAVSIFFQWTIIGIGQPGQIVRLMAFRDARALGRAICVCGFYYSFIYFSLLVVFTSARALYPLGSLGAIRSDQIMPFMIRDLAMPISPVLAGFLLAAPYAAIMSTVAAYLLIVSSSLVRDLYQRFVSPNASNSALRRLSYSATLAVGVAAFVGALWPPDFLQEIVVFSTAGLGVSLLAPVLLGVYWRRASRAGAFAAMGGGALCHVVLHTTGQNPLGLDPQLWALAVALVLMIGVSLASRPPSAVVDRRYFFVTGDVSVGTKGP